MKTKELVEKLREMAKEAKVENTWDYNGWRTATNSDIPYTQKDWNETLLKVIDDACDVLKKTTGVVGNTLVVSLECAAILDDNPDFLVSMLPSKSFTEPPHMKMIGQLGKYSVYIDAYLPIYAIVVTTDDITEDTKPEELKGSIVKVTGILEFKLPSLK